MIRFVTALLVSFWAFPTVASAGPPKIDLWYGDDLSFGHLGGHPQRWVNVLGSVQPAQDVDRLSYCLNDGDWQPLSFHEDKKRIARDGDFNVEIARELLRPGRNRVTIQATGRDGVSVDRSVEISYDRDAGPWPLPYTIDWSSVSRIDEAAQVVDGKWELTSDGIRSVERYYDRVIAFGDASWKDYEVTTSVMVHAVTGPNKEPNNTGVTHAAIALRWPGHDADGKQPTVKWHPLGATAEFRLGSDLQQCRWRVFDGQREYHRESMRRRTLQFEERYAMKHRVETLDDGRSRYRTKLWPADEPEPNEWDFVREEPTDDVPNGSALLLAHHSDVTFGNVQVVSLDQAKSQPETR